MHDNVCGWCDTFFCIRDVRRAISVIGIFSLTTSMVQILVQVAVFTGVNEMGMLTVDGNDREHVTYQLYIALAAADFIVIVFAIVLLYGNERTDEVQGRKFLMPWLILIPFYIFYESAINIFYFVQQFQKDKYQGPLMGGNPLGFSVVPLVYWVVKDIFLLVGFMFIIMRVQSLRPVVQYVQNFDSYQDCDLPPPPVPVVMRPSMPAPHIALPTPVKVAGCSSCNACSGSRCDQCSKPTPLYGYAGPQASSPPKAGWTTSIYTQSR